LNPGLLQLVYQKSSKHWSGHELVEKWEIYAKIRIYNTLKEQDAVTLLTTLQQIYHKVPVSRDTISEHDSR
jgi:PhoPQ-activated pathogenicity-related protein